MRLVKLLSLMLITLAVMSCSFWRLGTGFIPPYPTLDSQFNDFGNAGPPYPTGLAANGARTGDISKFGLGVLANVEADWRADDDVDGVFVTATAGAAYVTFFICNRTNVAQDVHLNALIDSNGDGQWKNFTGPGGLVKEHFVVNRPVHLNASACVFESAKGQLVFGRLETWVRAMVSDAEVVPGPDGWDGTGFYQVGEVEDYHIKPEINTPTPTPYKPVVTPTKTPTRTPTPTPTKKFIITVCGGTPAYDKPNGKQIGVVKQTREGEELGRSTDGKWVHVRIHNDEGWIPVSGLAVNGQCSATHTPVPPKPATPTPGAKPGTK